MSPPLAVVLTLPQFDYSAIDSELAAEASNAAKRIRERNRKLYENAVEIGHELMRIRSRLEHGHFLEWIEAECVFSKSAAYSFIDLAESLPDKFPNLGSLPLAAAYELAARSTPEPVRQEVVRRLEAGERLATGQIVELVRVGKQAKRHPTTPIKLSENGPTNPQQEDEGQRRAEIQQQAKREYQDEKHQPKRPKVEDATRKAAQMVVSRFGDQLGDFAILLAAADIERFRHWMIDAGGLEVDPYRKAIWGSLCEPHGSHFGGNLAAQSTSPATTDQLPNGVEQIQSADNGWKIHTYADAGDIPLYLRRSHQQLSQPDESAT